MIRISALYLNYWLFHSLPGFALSDFIVCYCVAQQESVDQTNTGQQGFMFCFVCLKDIIVRYLTGDIHFG